MKLGQEFTPSNLPKGTTNMVFSPENLEIWINSREYSRPIPTAIYPPFMKFTHVTCARSSHTLYVGKDANKWVPFTLLWLT